MDEELKQLLTDLVEEILYLRKQTDESALNETALIATLKEIVPDFSHKFDQWRMKTESVLRHPDEKTLEALRKALKNSIQ